MKIKYSKKTIVSAFILIIFSLSLVTLVWNNINFLFLIAGTSDVPSKKHYFFKNKILQVAVKKDIGSNILKNLNEGRNENIHDFYIHVLGLIGNKNAFPYLLKSFEKYQSNADDATTVLNIIDSWGLVGTENSTVVLKRLLDNYKVHRLVVPRYVIARAIYLSTGERYDYVNKHAKETRITVTEELENAREVIERTENRKRSFEEMMTIDKVFRPPDW